MTGKPVLQAERCATCIFRPGNPMHLAPGRLAEVVEQNRGTGSLLICHKTTYGQAEREAICRGYFDAYGKDSTVVQVMERLYGPDWYEESDEPGPDQAHHER